MKLAPFLLCLSSVAFASQPVPPPNPVEPPGWDADLWRQNEQLWAGHAEFLYWATVEGGLNYAVKMNHPGPDISAAIGKFHNSEYNIEPGLRVSVSFFRAPHYWELWYSYTRLTARGTDRVSAPSGTGEFLDAAWPFPGSDPLTNAKSSIHLNYNVADGYFCRVFHPNEHLRVRMIGGISGTWLDQTLGISYKDAIGNTEFVRTQWKYWGCGLRGGIMGDWYWYSDFYITSRATLAAYVGNYRNRTYQAASTQSLPLRNADYTDARGVINAQFLLGPSWQKSHPKWRIELFAGYEINMWANLQEVYHSTLGTPQAPKETWINSSLLTLNGLTTRITIDY